jgi:hypothetical protein
MSNDTICVICKEEYEYNIKIQHVCKESTDRIIYDDDPEANVASPKLEEHLDPLLIHGELSQLVRDNYKVNINPGSSGWIIITTFCNVIHDLRAKKISSPEIENILEKRLLNFFATLYQLGKVGN